MDLRVTQTSIPGGTRRLLHLENLVEPDRAEIEIFFDLLSEEKVPEPEVLDGFVMGILFYAMRTGQDIHVQGSMSRNALRNINEFQDAWCLWKPWDYKKIGIFPQSCIEQSEFPSKKDSIAAFSGGVDSIFTLLRHTDGQLGKASFDLEKSVLMVHGFDVPLQRENQLTALIERTSPLAKELGIDIKVIRTNLKELDLQMWEDSFLSQLACCMHNYAHDFAVGLVGSSEPYDALLIPWGSSPITDHLLSGDAFRVVHDGAAFSRTEKIADIARNPTAQRIVKVCWEGKETHKNCGACEKCIRTRLNFLAVGVENPTCFETPLSLEQIRRIPMRNDIAYMELASIVRYAKENGRYGAWLKATERAIFYYKLKRPFKNVINVAKPKLRNGFQLLRNGQWQTLIQKIRNNIT